MPRSLSTVLILIILLITFPFWVSLAGGLFGLIGGLFGLIFGIIGAMFGALGSVFDALFGWHGYPRLHFNGFAVLAFIIIIALVAGRRNRKS